MEGSAQFIYFYREIDIYVFYKRHNGYNIYVLLLGFTQEATIISIRVSYDIYSVKDIVSL